MSLRTHRRVSPRTRRRYRAIRNFFRRTLSSLTSQAGIRINSSIAVNVTNLKHKVVDVKRQNYRDLGSVHNLSSRELAYSVQSQDNGINTKKQRRRFSGGDLEESETRVLYKTPNNLVYRNSQVFDLKLHNDSDMGQQSSDRMNYEQYTSGHRVPKRKSKTNKYDAGEDFNGHGSNFPNQTFHVDENSLSGFGSYDSLDHPHHRGDQPPVYPSQCYEMEQQDYARYLQPNEVKVKRRKDKTKHYKSESPIRPNDNRRKKNKTKPPAAKDNTDQHFISDIINKQYKPLSFFGRRASDFSRISTPVCRDRGYSAREPTLAESEASSCYRAPAARHRYACAADVSDIRSVCDTRLYSAPRPPRPRHHRRHVDDYNDASLYDVVPVKEKSSPKSRRKFIEDMTLNEVPPSPRTQRPRFNLETQNYGDYEDCRRRASSPQRRSPYRRRRQEYIEISRRDVSSEESQNENYRSSPRFVMRTKKTTRLLDDIGTTMSSQQYLAFQNNTTSVPLNNTKIQNGNDILTTDKTDKALFEIKNILQSFLQELKKDSSTSQCDEASGTTNKNSGKQVDETPRGSGNGTSNALKNSAASSFNCGPGQVGVPTVPPQFMPGFANPCCYPPILPMYGAHGVPCLPNGCLVASPSCMCACAGCGHNHRGAEPRDAPCRTCSKANCSAEANTAKDCETDELIREIYNYVARKPSISKKVSSRNSLHRLEQQASAGKSLHALRQDANVGTQSLRCSKSCEAVASRQQFESYCTTNPCYSDSLIGKFSQHAMDYEIPCETNEYTLNDKRQVNCTNKQPAHNSKFISALRHIRKNAKKIRKENIQEVCHSDQTIEVDVMPKMRHNYKQEFATYTMHGQEFLHPPSAPPHRYQHPRVPPRMEYDYPPYDPRIAGYSSPGLMSERYDPHYDCMPQSQAPGPMYDNPYEQYRNMQPQVPLCLREVEVRSMGTQSEKRAPYFRMFSQTKKQRPESPEPPRPVSILRDDRLRPNTTQTYPDTSRQEQTRKLFNINLKPPAKPPPKPTLTERIQKDISKNDASATASKAVLKKLFYKRNPFSPQNRFVRTIMEKDTTVFKWRPRLFV